LLLGVRDSQKSGMEITVDWRVAVRNRGLNSRARDLFPLLLLLLAAALPLAGREKDRLPYGEGLIVNVPLPENEVEQVVEDVAQNGVIRGTKEYNNDEFVKGAKSAASSRVFPAWDQGGKVFYKVREQALDPRNFKDSSDVGTLVVRYVVLAQDEKNTVLRIDARFMEDFRHLVHASNGSVESAEYKDIHDRLEAIELMKAQTAEAQREKEARPAKKQKPAAADETPATVPQSALADIAGTDAPPTETVPSPPQTLEQHLQDLRRQVQRLVKAPGAPLKSAPFHTATTLQSLPTGTEVLIVVSTTYWLGVETHEGQHGWILRDELEQIP
jgi:hypothetical protein